MDLSGKNTTSQSSGGEDSYNSNRLSAYKRLARSAIRRAERVTAGTSKASHSPKASRVKPARPVQKPVSQTPTKKRTSVFIEDTSDADDEKPAKKLSPGKKGKERSATPKKSVRSSPPMPELNTHSDLLRESSASILIPDSPELPFNPPIYPDALVNVDSFFKMFPRKVSTSSTTTEQDLALAIDDMALTTPPKDPVSSIIANAPTRERRTPTPTKPLTLITENIDPLLMSSSPCSYISPTPTPKFTSITTCFQPPPPPTTTFQLLSTTLVHPPLPPPPYLQNKPATQIWTTANMHCSRPTSAWGWNKRWTCCQCGAETIVEQKMCSYLLCGHEKCGLACGLEWGEEQGAGQGGWP